MKINTQLPFDIIDPPDEFTSLDAVREIAQAAERAGFNEGLVTDHPAPTGRWLDTGGHYAQGPFVMLAMLFTSLRLGLWVGRFKPVEAIGRIAPRPIYLIQGGRDLRIPMSDFQKLWAAAKEPKEQWLVPQADHGDPWMIDREGYERRLVDFFRKALP